MKARISYYVAATTTETIDNIHQNEVNVTSHQGPKHVSFFIPSAIESLLKEKTTSHAKNLFSS